MQISINTAEANKDELTALIALCASLGGRLPAQTIGYVPNRGERPETVAVAKIERPDFAQTDKPSDSFDEYAQPTAEAKDAPSVDSNGLPWDARIHSDTKATNADGSWRKRRGVDDATFAAVTAELTGTANDAPPPPPPAEPTVPLAPTEDAPPPPPPAPAETPSENAVAAPAVGNGAFENFPAFVSAVSKHGKSYVELNELAASVGVAAFKDMKDHADKWDLFFSMLG